MAKKFEKTLKYLGILSVLMFLCFVVYGNYVAIKYPGATTEILLNTEK